MQPGLEIDPVDITSCGKSDSNIEMALIAESFRKSTTIDAAPASTAVTNAPTTSEGFESSGTTSQDVTLSEIRERTQDERSTSEPRYKKPKRTKRATLRGVTMREELLSKIGWTRSFISGPADTLHNSLMVWCHIFKRNFSIKTKGTMEILMHHRTEKHLRRDQRWRYEHLKSTDPVTGKVQHRVRERDGKVVSKIKLATELPKFIHAELVDIGERYPFYEDFIQEHASAIVTPESRAKPNYASLAISSKPKVISQYSATSGPELDLSRKSRPLSVTLTG